MLLFCIFFFIIVRVFMLLMVFYEVHVGDIYFYSASCYYELIFILEKQDITTRLYEMKGLDMSILII